MNSIDLALVCALTLAALRGWWRGFFRESFGVLALIGGVAAAFRLTPCGVLLIQDLTAAAAPLPVQAGVSFVLIFFAVYGVVSLCGFVFERLFGASMGHFVSCAAGGLLGAVKGAAVLALFLLFVHLFPLAPNLDARIMTSSVGRSLVNAAGNVIRTGLLSADTPKAT